MMETRWKILLECC